MSNTNQKIRISLIALSFAFLLPIHGQGQSQGSDVRSMNQKIKKLSSMIEKLKAEQANSQHINGELNKSNVSSDRQDKLRLQALKRKQSDSRARIDELAKEIILVSKQLQDPETRYAVAKRMQTTHNTPAIGPTHAAADTLKGLKNISARSIDLAAVTLVREGKALDQARLLIIDDLTDSQVLNFYRGLEKEARFELYDIADEIAVSENIELVDARRTAIYFYLFTK